MTFIYVRCIQQNNEEKKNNENDKKVNKKNE